MTWPESFAIVSRFIYLFFCSTRNVLPTPTLSHQLVFCVCVCFNASVFQFFFYQLFHPFPGSAAKLKILVCNCCFVKSFSLWLHFFFANLFLISCNSSLISSVNVSSSKSFELFNTKCVSWVITRLQKVLMDTRPFFSAQSLHLHYSADFCDFLSTMYSLCKISSLLKGLIKLSDKIEDY